MSKDTKNPKIGSTVFVINKASKKMNMDGTKILPAKVVGYEKTGGKVIPLLRQGKLEPKATHNHVFTDLEEAIKFLNE